MREVGGTMAVVLLLLLGSGCGGDELSASAFRAQANAICRDLLEGNQKAFIGIDQKDGEAMAKVTKDIGRRTQDALEEIEDLEGPESAEAGRDRFLEEADAFGETVEKQADAARDGDAGAATGIDGELRRQNERVQQAARDAGLTDCAT